MSNKTRSTEELLELVNEKGFDCRECTHRHTGLQFAFICIGCVCEYVPDFEAIKADDWPEIVGEK